MRRPLPVNKIIIAIALPAALLLTVFRQSPEGLITFGIGDREVRAAPGAPAVAAHKHHNLTKLDVFNRTLVRIREQYVDPERIDPKRMLFASLDSVQFNVPEVLIEPYPERDEVVVVVNDKSETFSTKDVDSPWRLSGKLKKIFTFIQANMNPGADLAAVEYAAVNGMLSTLDPHSVLLDPEAAEEMDISTSGHFGGLGIVIGMRKGNLTVIKPILGTPAHEAGVKAGDHIFKINEEHTEHLTLNQSVSRMRGKEGTSVTIWVKRKNGSGSETLRFDLVRAIIQVDSVKSKLLSKNVGYLKIESFQGTTARELKSHMDKLEKQGATAWVVDLRWNPGGLLEQAIQVSDVFLEHGTIVTTVSGREREARRAKKAGTHVKAPVVVLVNGSSASASEIVAGALKNLDRAVIVGSTTFGKGSVQILYDNSDGSKLKLTIAEYLTPGDLSIQSLGVPPDIELVRMRVPDDVTKPADRVRLLRTKHTFREADLDSHLTSKHAKSGPGPAETVSFLYEPPADAEAALAEGEDGEPLPDDEIEPVTDDIVEDFEIKFARDLAAQSRSGKRSKMLEDGSKFFAKRRADEEAKVIAALGKLGIDWNAPTGKSATGAAIDARIAVTMEDGAPLRTGEVKAGDTVKFTATVTNKGSGPAYRVLVVGESEDRLFDELELPIGKLEPGQTRTFAAFIKVPQDNLDRIDRLTFKVHEHNGVTAAIDPVKLRVVSQPRPVFAYAHHLIDDGNGDGLLQKNEPMRLRVTIKNIGDGKAHDATALLSNTSGGNIDGVNITKGRFVFDDGLKPGESRTVEFAFGANELFDKKQLVLELLVYDSVLRETVTEKLRYDVASPSAGPRAQGGAVVITRPDVPLLEGAGADTQVLATAPKGSVFAVTGQLGPYLRIDLGDGTPAFVMESNAAKTSKKPRAKITERWQVTPPTLALTLPNLETNKGSYVLEGRASDDSHVEDVYIFVSNREAKIDNRKVFYRSNRGGKSTDALDFRHEIPLWPGNNLVTVVVRENDEVKSMKFLYLYRTEGPAHLSTAK